MRGFRIYGRARNCPSNGPAIEAELQSHASKPKDTFDRRRIPFALRAKARPRRPRKAANLLVPNGIYLREDFSDSASTRMVVFYDVRNRGRSDAVTGDGSRAASSTTSDDLTPSAAISAPTGRGHPGASACRDHGAAARDEIPGASPSTSCRSTTASYAGKAVSRGPHPRRRSRCATRCPDSDSLEPQRAQMDPARVLPGVLGRSCGAFTWSDPANAGPQPAGGAVRRAERAERHTGHWTRCRSCPRPRGSDLTGDAASEQAHHPVLRRTAAKIAAPPMAAAGTGRSRRGTSAAAADHRRCPPTRRGSKSPDVVFSAIVRCFLGVAGSRINTGAEDPRSEAAPRAQG